MERVQQNHDTTLSAVIRCIEFRLLSPIPPLHFTTSLFCVTANERGVQKQPHNAYPERKKQPLLKIVSFWTRVYLLLCLKTALSISWSAVYFRMWCRVTLVPDNSFIVTKRAHSPKCQLTRRQKLHQIKTAARIRHRRRMASCHGCQTREGGFQVQCGDICSLVHQDTGVLPSTNTAISYAYGSHTPPFENEHHISLPCH